MACSCFGPQTFCGTLDPPYEPPMDPAWWIPDAIVLGVKVASVAHGMDVELVTVFAGEAQVGDTVRVWGDTGLLCRMYADSWGVGDTVVWGLRWTDMAGGPLEQEGDYLISVCGTYWLEYQNGSSPVRCSQKVLRRAFRSRTSPRWCMDVSLPGWLKAMLGTH